MKNLLFLILIICCSCEKQISEQDKYESETVAYFYAKKDDIISEYQKKLFVQDLEWIFNDYKKYEFMNNKELREIYQSALDLKNKLENIKKIKDLKEEVDYLILKFMNGKDKEIAQLIADKSLELVNLGSKDSEIVYKEYINKVKEIEKQEEQERLIEAENKRKAEEFRAREKERQEAIYRQFASDGSHPGLIRYIKSRMNDDTSFRHQLTKVVDNGNCLIVSMEYRGTNAFGAVMLGNVIAEIDPYSGEILSVFDVD